MNALTPWLNAQQVEGYSSFVSSRPGLSAVESNINYGVSFPSITRASDIRDAIGEMIAVIGGGTDAADALAACVETCNYALIEDKLPDGSYRIYTWSEDYHTLTAAHYERNGTIT